MRVYSYCGNRNYNRRPLIRLRCEYGLTVERVSTGFKYISARIQNIEEEGGKVFGGFEGNGGNGYKV